MIFGSLVNPRTTSTSVKLMPQLNPSGVNESSGMYSMGILFAACATPGVQSAAPGASPIARASARAMLIALCFTCPIGCESLLALAIGASLRAEFEKLAIHGAPFSRNALTAPGIPSIASRSGGEDAPTLPFHRALSARRSPKVDGQSLQTRLKLHRDSDISNANSTCILKNLAKTWQEVGNGSATKAAQGV